MKLVLAGSLLGALVVLSGCASTAPTSDSPPPDLAHETPTEQPRVETSPESGSIVRSEPDSPPVSTMRTFADHVRVDVEQGIVEFDGIVPIDCHHEDSPEVYLEVIACTKGTREHEALVMTEAQPSMVHAAMLLAGMVPGSPGAPNARGEGPISPSGASVRVEIEHTNDAGETTTAHASDWVVHVKTGAGFDADAWVFAGSKIVEYRGREVYDADGTGLLISLATFANARIEAPGMGGATLALEHGFSPEAGVAEPVWIANASVVPAYKTPVVVRLRLTE